MNYLTLMKGARIPWHNPEKVTAPPPDGWRLVTTEEFEKWDFKKEEVRGWYDQKWSDDGCDWSADRDDDWSYITNRPIPEKYRHLLEPEIPAGLPPLPEPPAGHKLVHRGFGYEKGSGTFFITTDYGYGCFLPWTKTELGTTGQGYIYYLEAVKIEEPAKEPDYDSDAHKLAVLMAAVRGEPCLFGGNTWTHQAKDAETVEEAIRVGHKVFIKPKAPEPVKVPLSDYRASELIRLHGTYYVIRDFDGRNLRLTSVPNGNNYEHSSADLFAEHGEIHRNGKWQPCFELKEKSN